MTRPGYDPQKAHEYYERTKKLKGRKDGQRNRDAHIRKGNTRVNTPSQSDREHYQQQVASARAKVTRLKAKETALAGALTKAKAALSAKRASERKEEKKNSDGKTTAKERQSAKEYRESHREELKKKEADRRKSGGSSSSGSTSVADMSTSDLETRISNLNSALREVRSQISAANQALGQLAHSAISELNLTHQPLQPEISRKESVAMTVADFSGYATRSDIQCADGRTILPDAFADQNGTIVPLVYQHGHSDLNNVLGHCRLETRPDGVYAHAFFNETAAGKTAKAQVEHGDLRFLSIFANNLVENVKDRARGLRDVVKGQIKEVSLVLAGANPGAVIDQVNLAHGSDGEFYLDEAIITSGLEISLSHSDNTVAVAHAATATADKKSVEDVLSTLDPEQEQAVSYLLSQAILLGEGNAAQHSETGGETVGSDNGAEAGAETGAESGTETNTGAEAGAGSDAETGADAEAGAETGSETGTENGVETDAAAEATNAETGNETETGAENGAENGTETGGTTDTETGTDAGDTVQHDNITQEDNSMTQEHNVFAQDAAGKSVSRPQATLSHDDLSGIIQAAKKGGSLREAFESFMEHTGLEVNGTLQHGIENLDYLFPDAKTLESSPTFLARRMEWVDKVLSGVYKSPFAKVKTVTADITPDEARARGYITGNFKEEEYFALSKRETSPQTIYKKQKLDRDDVIDITTLDVVAWLKGEMKMMLDEELAGAILVGDGRSAGSDDKIKESNIRPIATDAELYVTTVNVNLDDASSSIEELVDAAINNREHYKGTGEPTFYTSEAIIGKFLTVKDGFGRRIYANLSEVAAVLRVKEVVPVSVFGRDASLVGIMVNLADYTLGADKGGQATMFDDFDIDYNKLIYLIETRVSGALTTPKAALVFRKQPAGSAELAQPQAPARVGNTITVPTVTNVTYKNGETNATLTTASPITLAEGEDLLVIAVPAAGKYFPNNAEDQWMYEYDATPES